MNIFEYLSCFDFKNKCIEITLSNGSVFKSNDSPYPSNKPTVVIEGKINGYISIIEDDLEFSFKPENVISISLLNRNSD